MRKNRRLLNGELLVLDVPDADGLPPSNAISVLALDGGELELNSGDAAGLEHYLSISGTALGSGLQLRSGLTLRTGSYGGDPAGGLGFAISVGPHEVYGFTPSGDREQLAARFSHVDLQADPDGPVATPSGPATWSEYRFHNIAQVVDLTSTGGYLLDIRRARPRGRVSGADRPGGPGIEVRGGRLSRSPSAQIRPHVVLEADAFVTYGIPGTETALDLVAESMSGITTVVG